MVSVCIFGWISRCLLVAISMSKSSYLNVVLCFGFQLCCFVSGDMLFFTAYRISHFIRALFQFGLRKKILLIKWNRIRLVISKCPPQDGTAFMLYQIKNWECVTVFLHRYRNEIKRGKAKWANYGVIWPFSNLLLHFLWKRKSLYRNGFEQTSSWGEFCLKEEGILVYSDVRLVE